MIGRGGGLIQKRGDLGQVEGECPVRQGRRGSAQGAHRGGGAPSLQAPGGGDGGSEHRWSCAVPAAAGSGTSGPLKGPSNSCDATDKPERAILAQRDPQQCSISPPAATTEARKAPQSPAGSPPPRAHQLSGAVGPRRCRAALHR